MSESVKFPQSVIEQVAQDRQARTVEAEVYEVVGRVEGALLRLERHVAFWDGVRVRTVNEQDWIAEQGRVATEEAAREAQRVLRQQVLAALDPLTGQLASANLTLAQAQAFVKALVFLGGGIDPATGRYRDPREWLK